MMDAYGPHTHHAHYDQQHYPNSASSSYYSHVAPSSAGNTQPFSSYDFAAASSTSSYDQYALSSGSGGVLTQLPTLASSSASGAESYHPNSVMTSSSSNLTATGLASQSTLSQPHSQTHTPQSSQSSPHFYGHHAKSASLSSNSSSARSSPLPQTTGTAVTIPSPSPSNPSTTNGKNQIMVNGTPLSRPFTHKESELLAHLDRLKFFLATAPSRWVDADGADEDPTAGLVGNGVNGMGTPMMPHPNSHPALNRFLLPSGEYVSCVLWSGLYHITGTDIVRALVFRFEAFGRPVRNMKKFEEGVFSDLRNLKPGTDACLEEPKSPFLDLLFKYQCIRTQKKQKVFYWFSVPHDRLFLDALERDLKREKMGLDPTTHVVGEPALSFTYDSKRTLYEQFSKAQGAQEGEGELETAVRRAEESLAADQESEAVRNGMTDANGSGTLFNMFSLFEGSPNYKQRRKKGPRTGRSTLARDSSEDDREGSNGIVGGEVVDDTDGELNASAMFEAQMGLGGSTAGRHVQAQRQADNQRLVQAHHLAMLNRSRPQRHSTAPISHSPYHASPRGPYSILPSHDLRNHAHSNSLPTTLGGDVTGAPTAGPRKTKAYVCPLYSCQRLFKRLEHLKRHVRMHTMERPFQCHLCQRRFSRQDNLAQHIRTHQRDGPQVSLDAPGEADGEENVEQVDLNTCEIEVTDQMRIEDDDSFSLPPSSAGNGVFGLTGNDTTSFPNVVMSPENSPRLNGQGEWTTGTGLSGHSNSLPVGYEAGSTQSSPSFGSTGGVGSGLSRYTTSYGSSTLPTSYLQAEYQNATFPSSSAPNSAGSLSAPAHKQTFDHNTLYPTSLGLQGLAASNNVNNNASIGPVRRYRSVTPTIPRAGESIRRPSTANFEMGAYGNGNVNGGTAATGARGYHPYAAMNQYSASATSSPAQFNAQLVDYVQQQQQQQQQQTPSTAQHSPAGSVFQDELQTLIGATGYPQVYSGGNNSGDVGDNGSATGVVQDHQHQHHQHNNPFSNPTDVTAAGGFYGLGTTASAGGFF